MSADRVLLTVPSRAEYAKTVRMTASALVSRLGMTYDDVDDVRIAAEEAFVYAVDHAADGDDIELEFLLEERAVHIRVALPIVTRVTDEEVERRTAYATFILQSVCDHFEMSSDESGSYLRVTKSVSTERPDAEG